MVRRGTRETKGEKKPDSAESESSIHGLQERGEGASCMDGCRLGLVRYNIGCGCKYDPNIVKCKSISRFPSCFNIKSNRDHGSVNTFLLCYEAY